MYRMLNDFESQYDTEDEAPYVAEDEAPYDTEYETLENLLTRSVTDHMNFYYSDESVFDEGSWPTFDSRGIINEIYTMVRILRVDCICIDSLQFMELASCARLKMYESETHHLVYELHKLAVTLNVAVILVTNEIHPGETLLTPDGGLDFFKTQQFGKCESDDQGACAGTSDIYLRVWCPENDGIYSDEAGNDLRGLLYVKVLKNHLGPQGSICLKVNENSGSIDELDDTNEKVPNKEVTEGNLFTDVPF